MRINEIAQPKGPKKINTGSGSIANPAYGAQFVYEGDPENYNFGRLQKQYQLIKDFAKKIGSEFTYIGVGQPRIGSKLVSFACVSPLVVWYKYESGNPGAGQNYLYIRGIKLKTSDFLLKSDEEKQAIITASHPLEISIATKGVWDIIDDIARAVKKKDISIEELRDIITQHQPQLLDRVAEYMSFSNYKDFHKIILFLQLLKSIGIDWFTLTKKAIDESVLRLFWRYNYDEETLAKIQQLPIPDRTVAEILQDHKNEILQTIAVDLVTQGSDSVESFEALSFMGLNWNEDIVKVIEKNKKPIIQSILKSLKSTRIKGLDTSINILKEYGITWPELDTIERSLVLMKLKM